VQLPQLCSLSYEGPADRRTPGLDITSALAAVAGAAAAPKRRSSSGASGDAQAAATSTAEQTQPQACGASAAPQQQQQQQQLARLELRAGRLPDSLVEVVGRISSLRNLRLTATTAVATAPLAQLQRLSQLALTVTPPLLGALAPLAGLKQLAVLHLAAISPARGWGSAFQLLKVRSGVFGVCRFSHVESASADSGSPTSGSIGSACGVETAGSAVPGCHKSCKRAGALRFSCSG
jgi:hypothetical protein